MSAVTTSLPAHHPLSSEWVISRLSSRLQSPFKECPLTVAFSGGVDSTVLLHLLTRLRDQGFVSDLKAVHVHHGLSEFADHWAEYCRSICDQWNVPLTVTRVALKKEGNGLEQAARDARYRVFVDVLPAGGCLLQGHHRDDQAETILLRLFRGTGMDGVQGIPEYRTLGEGTLFRPLLTVPRAVIDAYAAVNELKHIEDDSNTDEQFSRNFLRQRLIPMIEERWPGASGRLVEFASEAGQLNERMLLEVKLQLEKCLDYRPEWLLEKRPLVRLDLLRKLEGHSQRLVVREWLKMQGCQPPSRDALEQIFREVIDARIDAEPRIQISDNFVLSRYQEMLVVMDEKTELLSFSPMLWDWQKDAVLNLGGRSLVCHKELAGSGKVIYLPQKPLLLKRRCHISSDAKFAISGRKGRKTLKKWLQEYKVAPWLREYLPFIFDGDQMVAAPGLWVCEGYLSASSDGFSCRWQTYV